VTDGRRIRRRLRIAKYGKRIEFFCEKRRHDMKRAREEDNWGKEENMKVDFNSVLLLIIAVEVAMIYVKLPRK
jgi:hypothetical protein